MSVNSRRRAELKGGVAPWIAVPETGAGQDSAGHDVPAEPILKAFFSKEELAAELGRNPRTLDRWEMLGTGPPRTLIGREVRYRRTSVQKWLHAQERQGEGLDCDKLSVARQGQPCRASHRKPIQGSN
jgi:hypothetical protein